jgi:hypothetical protein
MHEQCSRGPQISPSAWDPAEIPIGCSTSYYQDIRLHVRVKNYFA